MIRGFFRRKKKETGHLFCSQIRGLSKFHLHSDDFITKYPLDFVAHGFAAGGAEMDSYSVCSFADFLHKHRSILLRGHKWHGDRINGYMLDSLFITHRYSLRLKCRKEKRRSRGKGKNTLATR